MMRSRHCCLNLSSTSMMSSTFLVPRSRASSARSMMIGSLVLARTWAAGCGFATRAVPQALGFTLFKNWKR